MVSRSRLALVASVVLVPAGTAVSAGFDPLPASVWQMKEQPDKGIVGAVVLEDGLALDFGRVDHLYRVRILNDAGRDAAQLPALRVDASDVEGRTVYRDGREVRFGKQDMVTTRVRSWGFDWVPVTVLAAPGVTADCVVEVRWRERATGDRPLPAAFGLLHQWTFGHRYATLLTDVRISKDFPLSFSLDGPPDAHIERSDRRFAIRDLPAVESEPFSMPTLRPAARLTVFAQEAGLVSAARQGEAEYWQLAGRLLAEERRDVAKGTRFKAFAAEIAAGTPSDPVERAVTILERLEKRIVNLSARTWEERDSTLKAPALTVTGRTDLDGIIESGAVEGRRFELLYLHLLREAGLSPRIALVPDRQRLLFNPVIRSIFQFQGQLVGVAAPGGPTVWIDASPRFAAPRLILPAYQGARAFEIDLDTGVSTMVTLPFQPAAFNVRQFEYEVAAGEEEDQFRAAARFQGYPDYAERMQYMHLSPDERDKHLREVLDEALRDLTVDEAHLRLPAVGESGPVRWELSGRRERASLRSVVPFPGMPVPVKTPERLPEIRTLPILVPYGFVHTAVSRVRLPPGRRAAAPAPVSHENVFGRVSWAVEVESADVARVLLRVEMNGGAYRSAAYPALREYLGWVEEAASRGLALETPR